MKKVILVPDSFKGTMTSAEVCSIMAEQVRAFFPGAEVVSLPVADGGEGSVTAFLAAVGGQKATVSVCGPCGEPMEAAYGLLTDGRTAVVEMAACAGLPLVGENRRPDRTTTYGVGQLMADALARGCRRLILCLGGSATNDFGAGAAAALGVRFLDREGRAFVPVGGTLSDINSIDLSQVLPQVCETELTVMCDIDNPLYGAQGAAFVFAPQKGADAEMTAFLDRQLRAVSETVKRELGRDVSALPGAGAAGGMGGGMAAFFGAQLRPGIETVLDVTGFDTHLSGADFVFSGEGRLDAQSLRGKVVSGVARRCKRAGVPLIAVVGDIGAGAEELYAQGLTAAFSTNRIAADLSVLRPRCRQDLRAAMGDILRLLQLKEC